MEQRMRRAALALPLMWAFIAGAATAQGPAATKGPEQAPGEVAQTLPEPRVVWDPPTTRSLAELYPTQLTRHRPSGRVEMDCVIEEGGAPNCTVTRETPLDYGFGVAALRASALFRATPMLSDGTTPSVGMQTRLIINFPGPGQRSP
jgi:hypothetical protein